MAVRLVTFQAAKAHLLQVDCYCADFQWITKQPLKEDEWVRKTSMKPCFFE